ncbi:MAG: PIG-L deacetylase family protein [Phycisphaerae bacterium]
MNVLVIAAHPDDEVLGCGGTIARLSQQAERVHIAILGEGVTSRFAKREDADVTAIAELRNRAKRVAAHLGAASLEMFGLPDNRFDSVPLLDIVKIIEGLVERHRPEVVFTQHGGDLNIDHVQTFRATLTATRPLQGCPVRRVYAYEVPSSTEWAFQQFEPRLQPSVFVDVSETLDRKIAGMQMYDGETREFPHPRSPEALRSVATRWGTVVGCRAAEAFALVRSVNTAGPLVL